MVPMWYACSTHEISATNGEGCQSYDFLSTLWSVRNKTSPWLTISFAAGNVILNVLNYVWYVLSLRHTIPFLYSALRRLRRFYKMISAIKKRFDGSPKKDAPAKVKVDGEELLLPKVE